jgi:hypothetical protein
LLVHFSLSLTKRRFRLKKLWQMHANRTCCLRYSSSNWFPLSVPVRVSSGSKSLGFCADEMRETSTKMGIGYPIWESIHEDLRGRRLVRILILIFQRVAWMKLSQVFGNRSL